MFTAGYKRLERTFTFEGKFEMTGGAVKCPWHVSQIGKKEYKECSIRYFLDENNNPPRGFTDDKMNDKLKSVTTIIYTPECPLTVANEPLICNGLFSKPFYYLGQIHKCVTSENTKIRVNGQKVYMLSPTRGVTHGFITWCQAMTLEIYNDGTSLALYTNIGLYYLIFINNLYL